MRQSGLAERNHEVRTRIHSLIVCLPIEVLVLEEDDGVGVTHSREQEPLRVVWRRRHHDLEAGLVDVDVLGGVAVQFGSVDAAADRDADGERDRQATAGPRPHAGGVRADVAM